MIVGLSAMLGAAVAIGGVVLDRWWGEPPRAHPLIGFGKIAQWLEHRFNPAAPHANKPVTQESSGEDKAQAKNAAHRTVTPHPARKAKHKAKLNPLRGKLLGLMCWCMAVLPWVALGYWLLSMLTLWQQVIAHALMLWFSLGGKSLDEHIAPVGTALASGDLALAREKAGRVVSRDLSDADTAAIARAAVESALENGSDAVFAALFWFLIGGGPAAVGFRLLNTLDAMWGYRTPRLLAFGWAAARIDDVANYLPARLCALSYTLLGKRRQAWQCWHTQAPSWDSPNAGPVMAAGAGSLGVQLGGPARYHGAIEVRPVLGYGPAPTGEDVTRALRLVRATTWSWLAIAALISWGPALVGILISG